MNLSPQEIDQAIDDLVHAGLVETEMRGGEPHYRITARGQSVMAIADMVGDRMTGEDLTLYIARVYDAVMADASR